MDQSYPEDRPVDPRLAERAKWPHLDVMEEYSQDEEDGEDVVKSQRQTEVEERMEEQEEELEKCAKEDVDIMDARIEGMEAAMMEMNNLVQLMQKKVRAALKSFY